MNYFDNLLRKNPSLLAKYVSVATAVVDTALTPLNKLMHHVLVVQGIDPNTTPGEKFRREMFSAIDQIEDAEEYDKDYDFSWVERQWKKTAKQLNNLNLTKDRYRELTNLARLEDEEPHELQVVSKDPELVGPFFNKNGTLKASRLEETLNALEKFAEELELPVAKKVKKTITKDRHPTTVGKPKTVKKNPKKVVKNFKGVFRRTED
jgi:hypothetical protein